MCLVSPARIGLKLQDKVCLVVRRFEWTRAEFRQWARRLASGFKYRVWFTGVGALSADQGLPAIQVGNTLIGNTHVGIM